MCLSNVYQNEKTKENLLASDVATIETDGGTITLTDLFGRKTTVEGTIKRADLTGGVVILRVSA
ncbi:MAG: CooT family nickel-binding protein [Oscillospiraceae bacterium]|nr:CooT family nickel-binding protein [Oscillospiraceae bacterium]